MVSNIEPYVGSRPFEREEQDRFFGRDCEAEDLISLVIAHPTVVLYAQSGAGKTSLLNAKLIPLLEQEEFEALPVVRIGMIPAEQFPSQVANFYVFTTLMNWEQSLFDFSRLARMSLAEYLNWRAHRTDADGLPLPRIVVFDQFEELFSVYHERWHDREGFFLQLRDALEADHLLRILFVMREDYIAQLHSFAYVLPDKLRTRFRLECLRREAALTAITRPLKGTGRSFAEGVAEHLVEELLKVQVETMTGETVKMIGEFVEPIQLQVVCQSIWRELRPDESQVKKEHLDLYGVVDRALAKFYEDVILAASKQTGIHQTEIRRWCDSWLVTSTGTRGFVHRGPEKTAGMPNDVIDILAEWHLIRAEWRAGARWYELAHDRFVEPIRASNEEWNKYYEKRAKKALALLQHAERFLTRRNHKRLLEYYEDARVISEEIGDRAGMALALNYAGSVYEDQEDYGKALEAYERALALQESASDLMAIGSLLFKMERYGEAADYFDEYTRLVPDDPYGYSNCADALWYAGLYQEAVAFYTRELALHDSLSAYTGRGQVYAEMGEHTKAIADLDRAITMARDEPITQAYARNGRALAYAGLGQYDRALKEFDASIADSPHNAWVYCNRAQAYEWMGQITEAIADYKTALEKTDPRLPPFKRRRAEDRLRELQGETA